MSMGKADDPCNDTMGEATGTNSCGQDDEIIQPPWNETFLDGLNDNHPRPSESSNGLVGVWGSELNVHEISCTENIWSERLWRLE